MQTYISNNRKELSSNEEETVATGDAIYRTSVRHTVPNQD